MMHHSTTTTNNTSLLLSTSASASTSVLSSEPFSLLFHSRISNKSNNKNDIHSHENNCSVSDDQSSTTTGAGRNSPVGSSSKQEYLLQHEQAPAPQQLHHSIQPLPVLPSTAAGYNCCCYLSRSHWLYLMGSCFYVYLAIWDIDNEQSWYDADSTTSADNDDNNSTLSDTLGTLWNTTSSTTNTATSDSDHHRSHFHSLLLLSFVQQIVPKMDLYLFLSMLAASCYVLDAILCLRQTCRPTSVPPPQLPQSPHLADTSIRNDENHLTTVPINIGIVARDNDDDDSSSHDTDGSLMVQHRFHSLRTTHPDQPRQSPHGYTRMMAVTFGTGALLDLLAACTSEMENPHNFYAYLSTWAVVGAAHFYLVNAILVVVVASSSSAVPNPIATATTITTDTNTKVSFGPAILSSPSITYLADRLFLIGSIVDVSLSYFYIGESWDANITVWVYIYRGYLFSSLLWLLNAILYIVADIKSIDPHRRRMMNYHYQIPTMESGTVVAPQQQQSQPPIKSKRSESRYYSHHHPCDTPGNIDPESLLSDHSLYLHETTTTTTSTTSTAPPLQQPLPDTMIKTGTITTSSLKHCNDIESINHNLNVLAVRV